jgi:transposase
MRFFSLEALNNQIAILVEDLNSRVMRRYGKSRRQLFEEIERSALAPLPAMPFEYAEWKKATVHPDYHVEVDKSFYSVPHRLIGARVEIRLTWRVVEIFHNHERVASHVRTSQRSGHVTVNEHMPKAHQRYANKTPATLVRSAARIGVNAAILVERLMRERPHPEQGYRAGMGVLSLARRYGHERVERAAERALTINAISYTSLAAILKSGLDRAGTTAEPVRAAPVHANIRGSHYYQ